MTTETFRLTRDSEPPQVWVDVPRRIYSGTTSIPVTWGATDDSSGVARYDVQVSIEDGDWTPWLTGTLETGAAYALEEGEWFSFRVTATDNVSNAGSAEAQSSLARVTKYYYHGSRRVAQRRDGVVYYLHGDHLGSVSLATDAAGGFHSRQLFRPYGGTRYQAGTLPTDFGFAGQRHDGTGLLFMHARYYHVGVGRFVSADTLVPNPQNPQSLNRYAYVLNSPLRYTDPSGHRECGPFCEDEIVDEWTIGTQYAGEWERGWTAHDTEVVALVLGTMALPYVVGYGAIYAPGYVVAGGLSEAGYMGGAALTGQEIDPVDALLAFYIGGLGPESFGIRSPATLLGRMGVSALGGGVNNLTQYGISCAIHGDAPSGDEIFWNFASGGLAGALGTGMEEGLASLSGKGTKSPGLRALFRGAIKISPPTSDASAQWVTHSVREHTLERNQSLAVDLYTFGPASLGSSSVYARQSQSPDVFPWLQ